MNKRIVNGLIKCSLLVAIVAVMAGQPAKAQSLANGLTANIPFDFTVGSKKLPAGRYSVRRVLQESGDALISINNLAGKANIFRSTIPVQSGKVKNDNTLVFHRYGDQYFLFQIWPAGSLVGRTLPTSREEREIREKERDSMGLSAKKEVESETVNVVADLP